MLVAALAILFVPAAQAAERETLTAFVGCKIIAATGEPAIQNAVLLIRGTKIEDVGPASEVDVPASAERVDCAGGTLLPAFWNSHVHFMGPEWQGAAQLPAERLTAQAEAMLTRYGFAHVIDTGSDLGNTLALRKRIDAGEVSGPSIITAGTSFVGPDGTPFYLPGIKLPELRDPEQARRATSEMVAAGAGAIKIMSVSLTREQPFPFIPEATIKAVADEAHRAGVKLLVHPTNRHGVELALNGGADVLLHTAPIGGPWDEELTKRMAKAGLALTPTLKLWAFESQKANDKDMAAHFAKVSQQQVAAFRAAGGRVLFGTDVGYMTEFDPTDEYVQMAASGMSARDIVEALTTAPTQTFGDPATQGRLAKGYDADLVLLSGDPEANVRNFAKVRLTYRAGRRIYSGGE